MKKVFFYALTAAFAFLVAGCSDSDDSNEPSAVYNIRISKTHDGTGSTSFDSSHELYRIIDDGMKKIISKYDEMSFSNEKQANKAYQEAIAEINGIEKEMNDALAIGKDFGADRLDVTYLCKLCKDGHECQNKEFPFKHWPNGRISAKKELEADTRYTESTSGVDYVEVSAPAKEIHGWKLYTENGDPSDADFGINVTLQESSADKSVFKIGYAAKKGVNPGRYYILVTFALENGKTYDLKVYLNHKTA